MAVICTITMATSCVEETQNTLKFGSRAKLIKHVASVNEVADAEAVIQKYKDEVARLKQKLRVYVPWCRERVRTRTIRSLRRVLLTLCTVSSLTLCRCLCHTGPSAPRYEEAAKTAGAAPPTPGSLFSLFASPPRQTGTPASGAGSTPRGAPASGGVAGTGHPVVDVSPSDASVVPYQPFVTRVDGTLTPVGESIGATSALECVSGLMQAAVRT